MIAAASRKACRIFNLLYRKLHKIKSIIKYEVIKTRIEKQGQCAQKNLQFLLKTLFFCHFRGASKMLPLRFQARYRSQCIAYIKNLAYIRKIYNKALMTHVNEFNFIDSSISSISVSASAYSERRYDKPVSRSIRCKRFISSALSSHTAMLSIYIPSIAHWSYCIRKITAFNSFIMLF